MHQHVPVAIQNCRSKDTHTAGSIHERPFSALKRLNNYFRNLQSQGRLSSLALMNIEKSFLNKLQSKPSYLDEVIDLLAMKNRRIELN
jgi:hypothetical protein